MKLTKKTLLTMLFVSLIIGLMSMVNLKAIDDKQNIEQDSFISEEIGLEVGSVIYDMDEYGNMIERVVDDEDAITLEEAEAQYYEQFIGSADEKGIDYNVISIDENGNEILINSFSNLSDAEKEYERVIQSNPTTNYAIKYQNTYHKIKYATVVFKKIEQTNSSGATYIANTEFIDVNTGAGGYINRGYGVDAAYIETQGSDVIFKMGGVVGKVAASKVDVVPYSDKTTYVNYYKVSDGNLVHGIRTSSIKNDGYYSSSINIGHAPSYLTVGTVYYSYDGHYFYTDYFKMIDDYRNNNFNNAVNRDNPYYNYYQFLPLHSQTNYTADDLNRFIAERGYTEKPTSTSVNDLKSNQSLLVGEGAAFSKGLEYGVNPVLSMGIAINESGWGRSQIALSKNNLFGLNAVDSNPSGQADKFISVDSCVEIFMKQWVNWGYLDTEDYRYFGGHLGDKASGMNVKYASDAYWGEKAASHSYTIDNALGKKDFNGYNIVIKNSATDVNIRKEASTSSSSIYALKNKSYSVTNMPVIVLDAVSGENVSGNSIWYKINTDHPLDNKQTRITRRTHCSDNSLSCLYTKLYNFDDSYGYVSSSYFTEISNGTGEIHPPVIYKPGDVNGDGKVSFLDYVAIEKHIMETKLLSGDKLSRADVNEDGKVSFLDYVAIEKHIMGTKPLF